MEHPETMNVLVVEDDVAHAKIIRRAFEGSSDAGSVQYVWDGDLALDYVYGRGPYSDRTRYPFPDMILLDLCMPRMDGIDVLKTLKSDETTRKIPVIILTTSNRSTDVNDCYQCGANGFVVKPIDFGEFSRKVQDIHRFWTATAELPVIA